MYYRHGCHDLWVAVEAAASIKNYRMDGVIPVALDVWLADELSSRAIRQKSYMVVSADESLLASMSWMI